MLTKAKRIKAQCERNPHDSIELEFDQFAEFEVCAASHTPIYSGTAYEECAFDGSKYHSNITPQVPQNMQDDLQRMELEAREAPRPANDDNSPSSLYSNHPQRQSSLRGPPANAYGKTTDDDYTALPSNTPGKTATMSHTGDAPSFSPFPKVKGENIPPSDEDKEGILWKAREHVLHSNNVSMQLSWARDTLSWVEILQEAAQQ
ncbi:Coatomer subunit alpha like protein [Verticillium longisporum]|uniref:Coatomer subunit alpha like protein n=1 Tax=Verticillium longisporum TaxID=100787 RepID=A0A8I2ZE55_VERLO|nr:Coatomer subunit alpha like protein [Verticillium longisporum]